MFDVDTAAACAAFGLVSGFFVPRLIAAIPEPEPEPQTELQPEGEPVKEPEPKELYADIARLPRLALWASLASGAAAAIVGGSLGWVWALPWLLVLCPVGVALAVIDWRTHLLPTKVIAPLYGVVLLLIVVAALAVREPAVLVAAVIGWAIYGLFFFTLWFFSRGSMGYGDVRLSGVLGLALGATGLEYFIVGMTGGALLGAVASVVTWTVKGRKAEFAYGPYMLLGVLVAVTVGPVYADHLAGG
jgi:leader peptidase (prepilin peptidase) / N-methyltransferase